MKQPCKLLHFLIIWGSVAANLVMTNSVLLLPADIAGVTFHGIDDPALHLFHNAHMVRRSVLALSLIHI